MRKRTLNWFQSRWQKESRRENLSCAVHHASPVQFVNVLSELEQCKTDENGDAVHADCYLAKVTRTIRPLARRSKSKQPGEVQRL
jgi:hypothetical protein